MCTCCTVQFTLRTRQTLNGDHPHRRGEGKGSRVIVRKQRKKTWKLEARPRCATSSLPVLAAAQHQHQSFSMKRIVRIPSRSLFELIVRRFSIFRSQTYKHTLSNERTADRSGHLHALGNNNQFFGVARLPPLLPAGSRASLNLDNPVGGWFGTQIAATGTRWLALPSPRDSCCSRRDD